MYGAHGVHLGQSTGDALQQILQGVLAIPALQPTEAAITDAVNPYLPTVASGVLAGWWAQNKTTIALAAAGLVGGYFLLKAMR